MNGARHFDGCVEAESKSGKRGWRLAGRTAIVEDTGGNRGDTFRYVVDAVAACDG